jgi:hypothetical protein
MASIEINPTTGRPYGVAIAPNGKFFASVTVGGRPTISGPRTTNILKAKRQAEVIKALMGTGASNAVIHNAVKGVLS